MNRAFRTLRLAQLERALHPFLAAKETPRPQRGWIRAIREASGVTVREMAKRLRRAPSVAAHLEGSEAEYRITLGRLRDAADALGCQLVYALVPKNGTVGSIQELSEERARTRAAENVRAVEHSMALEDQAVGGVPEKIEEETKRILKRTGKR
jgi:predicted DNA-binding mobile mystery protein A